MNTLKLKIVSPERVLLETLAQSITLPTPDGQITLLPNHIPLVSQVSPGEMVVRAEGKEQFLYVSGGFVQVEQGGVVKLLADAAEHFTEINEDRAENARRRAKEALQAGNLSDLEYAATAAALERSLTRLNLVRKHSRRNVPLTGEGVFKE